MHDNNSIDGGVILPDPLIDSDVDLRDFAYMPLDVVRFRDSDFTAITDGEAFKAGVLLWCASWHQVPAGSLPNDDRILANLAGFGRFIGEWVKVKAEALHGWKECNDGRIYHPTICEKAQESWASKQGHHYAKFADRMRKYNKKLESEGKKSIDIPTSEQWIAAGCPKDWVESSTSVPQEFHRNSNGTPKESQNQSSGIPSNSALKGEVREHKGNNINICPPNGEPVPAEKPKENFKNEIQEVFEFWKVTFNKNNRTVLDNQRKSKIQARLKEGYTVEDIKTAIVGCSKSQFHIEGNHTDLTLICRDATKLDHFLAMSNPAQVIACPQIEDVQTIPAQYKVIEGDW
ncbi:DUF1376 domain-containing protein [Acinetobacter baumannii]|uniref:DUF1376 domain-containing protein n=1 Tax=Acinetobacter baumannii TaxID=470 RepID=UPI001897A606|nr:DUF1376 domain-containing protein [Acinetobacter baumannii]MBF6731338.1 DUF1376 domain-containing protein [Acinetobacter baumannii]MBF8413446.1 DUF1376 domain-containing protein [Acinetobacter baumannii]